MQVQTLHITLIQDDSADSPAYNGVMLTDDSLVYLRENSGDFKADFMTVFQAAKILRHGRPVTVDDSVLMYQTQNKRK